jgi:hypothetical protein
MTNAFTSSVLQKIVENFHGEVPIYIDHPIKGVDREEVGKSFKIGINDTKDDVAHEGFVWDPAGQRKITEEGYNKVSPEFDISYDTQGNIVNAALTGIVYVRNPAIGGTEAQTAAMCFDQGPSEFIMTGEADNKTPPSAPPAPPAVPPAQPPAQSPPPAAPPAAPPQSPPAAPPAQPEVHEAQRKVQYVTDPALVTKLNDLASKLEKYDAVVPGIIAQNELMKTQQLGEIANSLKEFGLESPEALVEGLPMDGKIKALEQLRARVAKMAPMTKGPDDLHARASRAEQDKALFTQVLTELGLTEEAYNRVMNGGKII